MPPGIVIGRGNDADLRITDPGVSRRHAEIRVDDRRRAAPDQRARPRLHQRISVNGKQAEPACSPTAPDPDRQHHLDPAPAETTDGPEPLVSELTLLLIRFAYLAVLWIFVLSASR